MEGSFDTVLAVHRWPGERHHQTAKIAGQLIQCPAWVACRSCRCNMELASSKCIFLPEIAPEDRRHSQPLHTEVTCVWLTLAASRCLAVIPSFSAFTSLAYAVYSPAPENDISLLLNLRLSFLSSGCSAMRVPTERTYALRSRRTIAGGPLSPHTQDFPSSSLSPPSPSLSSTKKANKRCINRRVRKKYVVSLIKFNLHSDPSILTISS